MKIAYVSDHLLPRTTIDTAQTLAMVSALAGAGAQIELVLPRRWGSPPPTAVGLADYYEVQPNFGVRSVASLYPCVRGVEKLAHALQHRRGCQGRIFYPQNASL